MSAAPWEPPRWYATHASTFPPFPPCLFFVFLLCALRSIVPADKDTLFLECREFGKLLESAAIDHKVGGEVAKTATSCADRHINA